MIGLSFVIILVGGIALLPTTSGFIKNFVGESTFPVVDFNNIKVNNDQDHYLVCPRNLCPEGVADAESPLYRASDQQLRTRLLSFVDNRPNITLKNVDLALKQFDFIEQTPGSSFPDIITVRIIPNSEQTSSLALYSRSVIGEGVEGANKRRIENWLLIFEIFNPISPL